LKFNITTLILSKLLSLKSFEKVFHLLTYGESVVKIFVTAEILPQGIEELKNAGHQVEVWNQSHQIPYEQLLQKAKDFDALITMLSDQIDRNFLEVNKHLKVITNYAVGHNNIDSKAATELGIAIGNTPDVLTEATADLALSLLLNVSRQITHAQKQIEAGHWTKWGAMDYLGHSLRGKTLGIFGAGRIGRCFATTCARAFSMNILYCARSPKTDFENELGAKRVEFKELLEQSDVVSVHCDLNDSTKELFNAESFSLMKPSSIFINTARGGVHNESDLISALSNSKIWGAGLDVTNPEPMSANSPLLTIPTVAVSPHIGSATITARNAMSSIVAQNILKAFEQKELIGDVNKLYS